MGNKDRRRLTGVNNTRVWEKRRGGRIRIPFFLYAPVIQGPSSLSPSPASPPLTHMPPGRLYSHHPILSSGEKFNLCIFIVVAHTSPVPHESFISLSLSLLPSHHICNHGFIQLPRWGMMMRKHEATSRDLPCWAVCDLARGWMKTACMEEGWSCIHIYAT